tara:strand:+ start:241 stop:408 length:168 start_codon:yes stop_codon:yes gene_type:complete
LLISGIVLAYGLFEYINYQEGLDYLVIGSIAVPFGTICFFSELIYNLKRFEESED